MLEELHIRDIALIEDAWITFQPGLTVLSGETGAGKTALLSALKLIMGERVDIGVIRHEASHALVEAQFSDETVVSRRIERSGRHKATLNGELANAQVLASTIGPLIDLHGQHEHQELLRVSAHGPMLDAWGGGDIAHYFAEYARCHDAYHAAVAHHTELLNSVQKAAQEAEVSMVILAEIERVSPEVDEDDVIRAQLPLLEHAEELSRRMQAACLALEGESGALEATARAVRELERILQHDERVEAISKLIESASIMLDEAARDLKGLDSQLTFDPEQLEQSLGRLADLESLAKRFGPTLQAVLDRREELSQMLALANDSSEAIEASTRELIRVEQALRESNQNLGTARKKAGNEFSQLVTGAMQKLEMDGCSFVCEIVDLDFEQWGSKGGQQVEFLFTPSQKVPPRPLVKIASGGEVSRVMLAIKGVLGEADAVPTLVFDEIDSGIGGATALAVGARLAELATTHQVIVVTHLAQVAAYAQHHYVVRKVEDNDGPTTVVVPVESDVRVAEIARMLSGEITDTSTQHARELLETTRGGATQVA